jgi:hypothetical protein
MKAVRAVLALVIGTAALSGCYYDPDYSYVRGSGYSGDAYYGEGRTVIYDDGYYGPGYVGPGYYDGGYYGGYGYPPGVSVGIGTVWYGGGSHHRGRDRDYRRGGDRHDYRGDDRHDYRGNDRHEHWQGRPDERRQVGRRDAVRSGDHRTVERSERRYKHDDRGH